MIQHEVAKYGFRIRTKSGSIVEHLSIHGRDQEDALRKLMQMYPGCEILTSSTESVRLRPATCTFEEVVDLIAGPRP